MTRFSALWLVPMLSSSLAVAQTAPPAPTPPTPPPANSAPPPQGAEPAPPPGDAPPPGSPQQQPSPPPSPYPAQPEYPPPGGYPPPQGYPAQQGYPPAPGYPPASGYPPAPGYPPAQGYPPAPGYPPPPGYAPPPYGYYGLTVPGSHKHDGGYVRMQLGAAFTSMKATSGGSSLELSGGGPSFGFEVGYAVLPDFIIYGALMNSLAVNSDFKVDGVSQGSSTDTAGVSAFGPGVAYYLEPSNVFFSATLLLSQLSLNDKNGNQLGQSHFGATLEAAAGKEWWVSDNWGLGVSGQLMLGAMKDRDLLVTTGDSATWNLFAFSVLFSATYN